MDADNPLHFAHYEVCRREDGTPWELGRGAMGVTYKAYDSQLRLEVALKVINPAQLGDRKVQALFLREARAAARVHQSNVASVIYLNQDAANPFYAMEFIAGESLHDWLRNRQPLPVLLALRLAEQIALGLEAIHAEQLVHRDLKPANIMIVRTARGREKDASDTGTETWQAKIIDFGLARAIAGDAPNPKVSALTTGFRGTAVYASPEQCEERTDLNGRSDLYSLGCILWEMLIGAPPFRGNSLHELFTLHITRPPPLERLAHLPKSVQEIVARLLVKDPDGRYADAAALVSALAQSRERIVSGEETAADRGAAAESATIASSAFGSAGETEQPTMLLPASSPGSTRPAPGSAAAATAGSPPTSAAPRRRWLVAAGVLAALAATALAVVDQGKGWFRPAATGAPMIAVLPFDAVGGSTEDGQLADQLTTELINRLSQIPTLRVISRGAVAGYRAVPGAPRKRIQDIARELGGVRAVIEGTVRRAGDKLKIDAVLFDAQSEKGLWAEVYEREGKDLFAVQADVAEQIAWALKSRVATAERQRQQPTTADNLTAHDLYARALKLDKADPEQRILFEKAVQMDPQFAEAYVALAENHWKNYARKTQAGQQLEYVAEFDAAVAYARKAVELDPDCTNCLVELSALINRQGKFDEAQAMLRRALKLAPNDLDANATAGHQARLQGRYDEGYAYTRRIYVLVPSDYGLIRELLRVSSELGLVDLVDRWTAKYLEVTTNPKEAQRLEIERMESHGELAAAMEQRRLQSLSPEDELSNLARQSNWTAVLAATEPPMKQELKNLGAAIVRAYAFWALGRVDEARAAATLALEEDQRYFETAKSKGLQERVFLWRMAMALQILGREADAAGQLELWDKSNFAAGGYYRVWTWWQPIFRDNRPAQLVMERMKKKYDVMAKRVLEIEKTFTESAAGGKE